MKFSTVPNSNSLTSLQKGILPPHLPKAPVVPAIVVIPPPAANMGDDVKQALLEMANSFREIGQTAKQNNTYFLGDIP